MIYAYIDVLNWVVSVLFITFYVTFRTQNVSNRPIYQGVGVSVISANDLALGSSFNNSVAQVLHVLRQVWSCFIIKTG